jgi:hypothetical protein
MNPKIEVDTNHGQVAHTIVNNAPQPSQKDESDLQKDFKHKTGIDNCPKEARNFLNNLLENHNFTVRQLRWAWLCKSIEFNTKTNKVKSNWTVANAVWKWFLLSFMMIVMVSVMLPIPVEKQPIEVSLYVIEKIWLPFLAFTGMSIFWHWPMVTAYRVRKIIEGREE